VHVRRAFGDIAQRRHLERALEHVVAGDEELELGAP
jgi:hypothetical protein